MYFLWNAVFFPQLLCISILLSLSSSRRVIPWSFYIAIFFPFHISPVWNPWLSLSTVQKITSDCWQAASTWPVHCCQGQAVNVLLHVTCCFLCNSCCSSGVCVFSVWLKFFVCVYMHKFGLQDCVQLSKVLLNLCLSEITHFCVGQYTTNTRVILFRASLTTFEVIFKDCLGVVLNMTL